MWKEMMTDIVMSPGMYRAEKKSWQILLSSTQAGPSRKVTQEQEESSCNHAPRLFLGSVHISFYPVCIRISQDNLCVDR